jgi:hypothetical protein
MSSGRGSLACMPSALCLLKKSPPRLGFSNELSIKATQCMIPVIRSPKDYQVYRISPDATNRLAIVFDRVSANIKSGSIGVIQLQLKNQGCVVASDRHAEKIETRAA